MRAHQWLVGAAVVLALIAAVVFVVPHTNDLTRASKPAATSTPPVIVTDFYKKGTHTLTVEVLAPTPCTSVTGQASVVPGASSSTPDTILIAIDMPTDTGICLEESATTTLTLTASADTNASTEASVNGVSVPIAPN